jgi:hypothetical protein
LRKRGYAVAINRSDNGRGSIYRIKAGNDDGPVAIPADRPRASETSAKPAQRLSKPQARRAA